MNLAHNGLIPHRQYVDSSQNYVTVYIVKLKDIDREWRCMKPQFLLRQRNSDFSCWSGDLLQERCGCGAILKLAQLLVDKIGELSKTDKQNARHHEGRAAEAQRGGVGQQQAARGRQRKNAQQKWVMLRSNIAFRCKICRNSAEWRSRIRIMCFSNFMPVYVFLFFCMWK